MTFGHLVPSGLLWAVTVSQTFLEDLGDLDRGEAGWSGILEDAPQLGSAR